MMNYNEAKAMFERAQMEAREAIAEILTSTETPMTSADISRCVEGAISPNSVGAFCSACGNDMTARVRRWGKSTIHPTRIVTHKTYVNIEDPQDTITVSRVKTGWYAK